jgi:hypothetical protein
VLAAAIGAAGRIVAQRDQGIVEGWDRNVLLARESGQ